MKSDLLNLIANFIVFGLGMWLVNAYLPMPTGIKNLLNFLVVIVLVLYILQFFGIINTVIPMYRMIR